MNQRLSIEAHSAGALADGRPFVRLAFEMEPANGNVPGWIQVMPVEAHVTTRDGRAFNISSPERVAHASKLPMLVDWEHQSESVLGTTRAAGWIEELAVQRESAGRFPRAGLWGRVDWTPQGKQDVAVRAFRYLSPVLLLDPQTSDVREIASVALTNVPALTMHSLEAFREALSARGSKSDPETEARRVALRFHGFSEAEIQAAEAHVANVAARRAESAPTSSDSRVALRALGYCDAEIEAAERYNASARVR
jgi:phage I-like protein